MVRDRLSLKRFVRLVGAICTGFEVYFSFFLEFVISCCSGGF